MEFNNKVLIQWGEIIANGNFYYYPITFTKYAKPVAVPFETSLESTSVFAAKIINKSGNGLACKGVYNSGSSNTPYSYKTMYVSIGY